MSNGDLVMTNRNIIITGFMGTGKSTIGALVASRLNHIFVDMDDEIVRRVGKSIPEIFAHDGEAYFRRLESVLLAELVERVGLVISTGGGTLVTEKNRQLAMRKAVVICLVAAPDVIADRLDGDTVGRPLAPNWRDLLTIRSAAYAVLPNHVDTTGKTPDEVVEEVVSLCTS